MAAPPEPRDPNLAQRRLRVLNHHLGAGCGEREGVPEGIQGLRAEESSDSKQGPEGSWRCRAEAGSNSNSHKSCAACPHSQRSGAPTPSPLALAPAMGNPVATSAPAHAAPPARGATSAACQPVVVGAMIMDIQARPSLRAGDIAPGTTVPGEVRHVHGGVGRNIAECMATVGCPPLLVSVVGTDAAGDALLSRWTKLGMSTAGIRQLDHVATPVVCAVIGRSGEMAAGVAQVGALEEHLTPQWLAGFTAQIQSAPLLLLDANLATEVLSQASHVAAQSGTPVWCDPVSVAKSARLIPSLSRIHFMTPNRAELHAMADALLHPGRAGTAAIIAQCQCGIRDTASVTVQRPCRCQRPGMELHPPEPVPIPKAEEVCRDALVLLGSGVCHVLVTLGERGALLVHRSSADPALEDPSGDPCALIRQQPTGPEEARSLRWEARVRWERGGGEREGGGEGAGAGAGAPLPAGARRDCKGSPCCGGAVPCAPRIESMTLTWFPALPLRNGGANTTGAGDCLIGAAAAAFCRGLGVEQAVGVGMLAARLAVESESNVPQELSQIRHLLIQ